MEKEQEIAKEEEVEVVEEILEDEVVEPELDDDGNEIEVEKELEPWQQVDAEEFDDVPVSKHIGMKQKLKAKLGKKNDKIAELEERLAKFEQGEPRPPKATALPERPKRLDFDDDDLYEDARDKWLKDNLNAEFEEKEVGRAKNAAAQRMYEQIKQAEDDHYERSGELVADSGMSSDNFKEADLAVKTALEEVRPGKGEQTFKELVYLLGPGSEKVMTFIGRNKSARAELQSMLVSDASGSKALVYLGQQKERLNNPKRKASSAPKPANNAKGDQAPNQTGDALKRKYDTAHKSGDGQAAYNLKKEARAAGVNTSSW